MKRARGTDAAKDERWSTFGRRDRRVGLFAQVKGDSIQQ